MREHEETAGGTARLEPLEQFFRSEVVHGERIVAWTRLTLGLAGLLDVIVAGRLPGLPGATGDSQLTTLGCLIAIAFSVWTQLTLKRASRPEWRLFFSVLTDAALIFLVTSGDVFWPDPDYLGVLREPGVGLFVLAAVGAGVRLSPRIALGGGSGHGGNCCGDGWHSGWQL